jgi:hypothetical protein
LMAKNYVYDFEIKVEGTELDTGKVDIVLTSAVREPYQIAENTFLMKTDGWGDFRLFKLMPPGGVENSAYISIREIVKTQSSPIEIFELKTYAALVYDYDEKTWTIGIIEMDTGISIVQYIAALMSPISSLAPRYGTLVNVENQNDKVFYRLTKSDFEATMAATNDILFFVRDFRQGIRLAAVSGELYTHICVFDADTLYKVRYNADKWEIYEELYENGDLVSTTILVDNELGDAETFPLIGWMALVFDIDNILIEE